jgi:hypothetical protein
MADYSIALQGKPMQITSQEDYLKDIYAIQNAQQANQLNKMVLGEKQRGIANTGRRNALLGSFTPDMTVDQQVNALAREGFLDEAKSLAESAAKVGKEKREAEKALTDTEAAHIKTMREYLPMVKDQETYDAWRTETSKRLPSYAGLFPLQYTPELNQTLALSADKALENHFVNQENVMVKGVPTTQVLRMPKYGTGPAATVEGSQGATYNKPAASTTINVSTNTAKKYGEVFATKAAEADNAMRDAAVSAPKQAENANNILTALNSGQLYLGAGADVKLGLARFLNMAGKDDNEKVANTQILMQGQSQATLNAIKSAGLGTSQGFTDKDLVFLKGIAGGTIALDGTTIRKLAELQHKAATESVKKWTTRRSSIPKDALEGTGIDQEAYEVPPMIQPPKGKPAANAPSAPAKTRSGATTSNW